MCHLQQAPVLCTAAQAHKRSLPLGGLDPFRFLVKPFEAESYYSPDSLSHAVLQSAPVPLHPQPFDLDSEENPSFMAWNYYPPVSPAEQEAFKASHGGKLPPRLHAHADMDVLTILFQRVGKYEICFKA
jgi:hypothetical protein